MQFEKIRNYEELLSHGDAEAREMVLKVTDQVLSRLDIYKYLKNLIKKDGNILTIGKKDVDLDQYDRVYAFSSGKAGNHMARSALRKLKFLSADILFQTKKALRAANVCLSLQTK